MTLRDVELAMRTMASPVRARGSARYFKTGPGEYGEGDKFMGLNAAQIHALVRECRALPLKELARLLDSPWHEKRLLAVASMSDRYPRADDAGKHALYALYLRRTDAINNWDLVDVSAPGVVGAHLLTRSRAPLHRLARSTNLWERRIAIVATQHLIRHGEFKDTLRLAVTLINDPEDLLHKAVGWMLREVGKRDERVLRRFLDRYAHRLPRTALRYSLERLPLATRARYMKQER